MFSERSIIKFETGIFLKHRKKSSGGFGRAPSPRCVRDWSLDMSALWHPERGLRPALALPGARARTGRGRLEHCGQCCASQRRALERGSATGSGPRGNMRVRARGNEHVRTACCGSQSRVPRLELARAPIFSGLALARPVASRGKSPAPEQSLRRKPWDQDPGHGGKAVVRARLMAARFSPLRTARYAVSTASSLLATRPPKLGDVFNMVLNLRRRSFVSSAE